MLPGRKFSQDIIDSNNVYRYRRSFRKREPVESVPMVKRSNKMRRAPIHQFQGCSSPIIGKRMEKHSNRVISQLYGAETISDYEKFYLQSVEEGNLPVVTELIEQKDLNLKCRDFRERSALELAVASEHLEIVDLLVDTVDFSASNFREALMVGISKGYFRIVELLLDSKTYKNIRGVKQKIFGNTNYFDRTPGISDSKFNTDISSAMLAAHCNNVDILQLLLTRGEYVPAPHEPTCPCNLCLNKCSFDPLKHSCYRLNSYKALASPAYISLTSSDPIETAFYLSHKLDCLAKYEKEFQKNYRDLSKQCKEFATSLLDLCQGSSEVDVIMNENTLRGFNPLSGFEYKNTYLGSEGLSRLKLAIKYEQKEFIAHPHCQAYLSNIWYLGLPFYRHLNVWKRMITLVLIFLAQPLIPFIYWFAPKSKVGEMINSPIMKFFCHCDSYIIFLILLLVQSIDGDYKEINGSLDQNYYIRISRVPPLQSVVFIFVIGLMWAEIKQIWEDGPHKYFSSGWNWIDASLIMLYLASYSIYVAAIFKIRMAINHFAAIDQKTCWDNVKKHQCLLDGVVGMNLTEEEVTMIGLLDPNRKCWQADDPFLMFEGLFAVANVLSFCRIFDLLPAIEFVGPLQVSLGRMLTDIVRFGIIAFFPFMAFFCAISNLYRNYGLDDGLGATNQTLYTLLWAAIGQSERDDAYLEEVDHYITEAIGNILYITYHVAIEIVLINMLIAMMAFTFETIQKNEDEEWKYARTKLWLFYMKKGSTLPVPFNIIPSPKAVLYFFKSIYSYFMGKSVIRRRDSSRKGHRGITLTMKIMKRLLKRYIFKMQQKKGERLGEGQLAEIKQDVSSLRFELVEILRKQGRKLSAVNNCPNNNPYNERKLSTESNNQDHIMSNIQQLTKEIMNLKSELSRTQSISSETKDSNLSILLDNASESFV